MSDFLERIQDLPQKRLALLADELRSQLTAAEHARTEAIAIVGVGCRFPGGVSDPEAYWQLLSSGHDPVTEVPPDRWDVDAYYDPDPSTPGKTYTRRGGFLSGVDQFDPDFFGISPREAVHMDPQQRLLLEVSWEALERSGHAPKSLVGSRTGVYVAIGTQDYASLQTRARDLNQIDAYTGSGNGFCFAAGRIAYALGLQGPNMALDAACASSLIAVHLACQSLRNRECERALVGGVNLLLSPETNVAFSKTRVMAADGRCKTFDAAADGYVRSEGCAAVVLRRLSDALADRDPILAVIKGSAMNHGGASGGLTIPNGSAQQTVIRAALAQANLQPQQIQYVETQGTGTPLGDAIEVRALETVLKSGRSPQHPLWLASVKTNIGHTETASGLASLIKVVLALQHQKLPPHLHLQQINPEIALDKIPAKIPTTLMSWPSGQSHPIAGVNAFGMSGTNAHVIVAAAPAVPEKLSKQLSENPSGQFSGQFSEPPVERPLHLLPLSAKTPEALLQLVQRYETYLAAHADVDLGDLCFTAGAGRSHFAHRLTFMCDRTVQLKQQLASYRTNAPAADSPAAQSAPKIVFAFGNAPAEIAVDIEPIRQLYDTQPVFKAAVDCCADSLVKAGEPGGRGAGEQRSQGAEEIPPFLSLPLSPSRPLALSPSCLFTLSPSRLFTLEYALAKLWQSWGIKPDRLEGEGTGRIVAECIAGRLSLEEAVQAVVSNQPQPASVSQRPNTPTAEESTQNLAGESSIKIHPHQANWSALLTDLGTLYQQGTPIDWLGFDHPYARRRLSLPTYPFQRQRYWSKQATQGTLPTSPVSPPHPISPTLSRAALLAIDPAQRQPRLAADLCDRIAAALGIPPAEITPETPLNTLALDSIMALELKFDLEKTLGSALSITALLQSQNIAALSAQMIEDLSTGAAVGAAVALPEIRLDPAARHQPFPLNDIQTAYWMGRNGLLDLGNVAAHVYAEFESENLECDRLNQAFQRLIDRHDMLRTVVLSQGEQQVLETVPPYTIDRVDLRQVPATEVEHQLMALRHQLSHQIHEPDKWPLFTVRAAQLEGQRLRLFLSFDNLLVDGASLGLLCWEWGQLYQDLDTPLTPLNLSFREYVLALKGFEQSEVYLRSLTYWQQRLADLPLAPDLPLATAPAALTQPRFSRLTTQIEAPTWQRLQKQAQTAGLTPSGLLVAAYAEILATWSKHRRFSLNLTTFNRLPIHPQVQAIVGDFTSLTLLAVDYSTPGSFWQRAQQLQHQLWQDLEHSYVSGVRVLRELARSPESATRVTMPVVFTSLLANPQLKRESAFGTDWLGQRVYSIAQTPQVWLDHQVYEETGALVLNWDAVQGLFPAGMVEAMFDAYVQLLETLAEQPDIGEQTRIASLPEQQRVLLSEFNATVTTLSDQCLHTLFLTQAEQQPQHLAVVAGSVQLTYADLLVRSQQLAQHLQSLNVKPNQLIAITLEKGWEQVVAVLGVLMSGAAYVPIDPALPQARRWHLLEQSTEPGNAAIVLTHSGLQTTLDWPEQSHTLAIDTADLPPVTDGLLVPQQPTDLAYVIYTSGSTGLPKGVMVDHRGAVNTILDINRRWEVGPCDRVFALSSLSFDLSVYDIFGTLAAGGTLVIPPTSAAKDPALWSEILLREQVTLWNSVPALMQMLVTYAAGRPDILPSSLRLVLLSGDWLPLSLPDQIRALVPDAQVVSLGGATEASIWSIFHNIEAIDPTWTSIPYGRPLANQQFYVLDAELETCPVWVPGQLYIGGAGLAKGYWRDQTKTAASFVTHPHTGKTLYRTGDLGRYRPSGQIEFLGREDTQVKIGGHRIELGEIETALEQHPEVAQGVVLTIGDSAQQLVAQVCLADNSTETARQLTSGQIPTISAWHHSSAESANSWQAMLSATLSQTAQIAEPGDWETFKTFWQHLQDLYQVAIGRVLSQTGAFTQPGDRHSWNSLQQSLQIHPRYHPWLRRALNQLIEQGYLQEQQAEYIQVLPLPESLPAELVQQLMTEANQAIGLDAAATRLLIEIVENLTDILTENQHSAEIYAAEAIPEVYQKQFHTSNLALQHAIASLAKIWQPEGPLRVLEVGAGIGSTTHYVLPMLPADRTTYVFTDLSNYFLQSAQQTFAAYPFLETRLLNLEQPPQTQDYELHSFDVVIASSVLHATRDIAETLNHIVLLLKPGGVLLLLEETQFQAPFDLTMGLQQGFDRFEDTALRQQHPLLSQDQWQQVLLTAGFTACEVLSQPDTIAEWLGFDVFIAQAPTPVRVFQPDNLKRYLSQKLPAYMVPQHYMALEAMPLTTNGKIDRRSLQALWTVTPSVESDYVAPQNAIQARVVEIWQALLSRDRIGIEDNFFELGGDSLIATQVVARVQDSFQVDVPLRHLFQAPTIAQLAAAIVQALAAQVDPDLIANLEAESEFNRLEPLNPEPLQLEGESFHG